MDYETFKTLQARNKKFTFDTDFCDDAAFQKLCAIAGVNDPASDKARNMRRRLGVIEYIYFSERFKDEKNMTRKEVERSLRNIKKYAEAMTKFYYPEGTEKEGEYSTRDTIDNRLFIRFYGPYEETFGGPTNNIDSGMLIVDDLAAVRRLGAMAALALDREGKFHEFRKPEGNKTDKAKIGYVFDKIFEGWTADLGRELTTNRDAAGAAVGDLIDFTMACCEHMGIKTNPESIHQRAVSYRRSGTSRRRRARG